MVHGLFELARPESDEQTPIPGFTEVSWRTMTRNAEIAIEAGEVRSPAVFGHGVVPHRAHQNPVFEAGSASSP